MNEIVNKFLMVGDKFMPEMHLKQPGFIYNTCGPFPKNKGKIEKIMQTVNTNFIYKNELYKACFQHDIAYGKSKDLVKRNQSDKVLKNKAFKIVSDPKYDGYQRGLASMVYKFFDKKYSSLNKSSGSDIVDALNYQLANELHQPIIRKFNPISTLLFGSAVSLWKGWWEIKLPPLSSFLEKYLSNSLQTW